MIFLSASGSSWWLIRSFCFLAVSIRSLCQLHQVKYSFNFGSAVLLRLFFSGWEPSYLVSSISSLVSAISSSIESDAFFSSSFSTRIKFIFCSLLIELNLNMTEGNSRHSRINSHPLKAIKNHILRRNHQKWLKWEVFLSQKVRYFYIEKHNFQNYATILCNPAFTSWKTSWLCNIYDLLQSFSL